MTKRCDDSMRGVGHSRDLKLDSGCHCDVCCKLTIPAADFRYQDLKFAVQRSAPGRSAAGFQPQIFVPRTSRHLAVTTGQFAASKIGSKSHSDKTTLQ